MANGQPAQADRALPALDPFRGVPDRRYHLAAEELLKPLLEPGSGGLLRWRKQASNAPIVAVENAYITGRLDLRGADVECLFRFENCRFEHPPDVREAKILGLVFRRCWLPGLKARNLRSRNDVRLIRCVVQVLPGSDDGETAVQRGDTRERGVPDAAINLTDAVVEGSVVLTRTAVDYPQGRAIQADRLIIAGALLAYRMQTEGEVRLPGMRTGGNVNFSGAKLRNPDGFALDGNGAHIGGSLLCEVDNYGAASTRQPFSAHGVLHLPSMRVNGDIVLRAAELQSEQQGRIVVDAWKSSDPYVDPWPALVGDRWQVDGNVELSDGLSAVGTLRMINAKIGGTLRLARARITVPRGSVEPYYDRALHLDGSQISSDLEATGLEIPSGQLRMADVTVRGNLLAGRVRLRHAERDVLSARRMTVAGNFHLHEATIEGTLRLQGVEVGGSVYLYGTDVTKPAVRNRTSFSVDLRTVKVGRDITLTSAGEQPFHAEGGVNMDGATAGRRIDFSGAVLGSYNKHAIALDASDVGADEFLLNLAEPATGSIVLRHAHCQTLEDNDNFWQAEGGIELEDFRYDVLKRPIDMKDDAAVRDRIERLRTAMAGYRPGPYDQLAAMLRNSGNEEHASTVLFKKQQYRYEALAQGYRVLGPGVRLWSWLQRWMVGYGYRPVRALAWLIALLAAGSIYFGAGTDSCVNDPVRYMVSGPRCAVDQQETGLEWNPVLYTLDLLVPIVDFGNKGRWYMHDVDKWVSNGFTAMGWILATTVAAGAGRMIRRET
ncbi:oxidoreductase [Amycolatopsis methanolica]|uniref:Membrane-associated oxidoreductase n=1 Tax=Amycolatopsis methanolica 239 TaxID=1068978 RepID=A0A076MH86_AMYME|nr:oxidoreductase [Amycolatopsis methanolica]AIJ20243.1 membrane-associated oxidoreductase [Amycolatopsis methanolica 239]